VPRENPCIPLTERRDLDWHCYVLDLRPCQLYGYRIHGPRDRAHGYRSIRMPRRSAMI
jgi:glycogen operon protein